jgi:hypothetical protein
MKLTDKVILGWLVAATLLSLFFNGKDPVVKIPGTSKGNWHNFSIYSPDTMSRLDSIYLYKK